MSYKTEVKSTVVQMAVSYNRGLLEIGRPSLYRLINMYKNMCVNIHVIKIKKKNIFTIDTKKAIASYLDPQLAEKHCLKDGLQL